jgi:hypothetical protein
MQREGVTHLDLGANQASTREILARVESEIPKYGSGKARHRTGNSTIDIVGTQGYVDLDLGGANHNESYSLTVNSPGILLGPVSAQSVNVVQVSGRSTIVQHAGGYGIVIHGLYPITASLLTSVTAVAQEVVVASGKARLLRARAQGVPVTTLHIRSDDSRYVAAATLVITSSVARGTLLKASSRLRQVSLVSGSARYVYTSAILCDVPAYIVHGAASVLRATARCRTVVAAQVALPFVRSARGLAVTRIFRKPAINTVRETIYRAFVNGWNDSAPYTFDNESFTPPQGIPWVRAYSEKYLIYTQDPWERSR